MLDGVWNTITSPLSLVGGTAKGAWNTVTSFIGGGVGSAVSGALFGAGALAIGTIFQHDILGVLRNIGKPEWANAWLQYQRANPHFMTQMLHVAGLGAVVGGTVGGATAAVSSVQSGFSAVPAASDNPAQNNARAIAQSQNVGHTVGSLAILGGLAAAGAVILRDTTGYDVMKKLKLSSAPETAAEPVKAAAAVAPETVPAKVSDVAVPALPVGHLQAEHVESPSRPAPMAVQNAQVSMGAVKG